MSWQKNARAAAGAGLLLLVSACGGGGGSGGTTGDGATGGTAGGNPATATGLIPAPPVAGATLYADAASLLPLRAGAIWHYRGTIHQSGATTRTYGALVTQSAGSAGGVSERRQSTAPDDDDASSYSLSGGAIIASASLQLAPSGPPEALSYTLLRSPVRQSEQITLVDRVAVPVAGDIDGDRVNDSADIAAYSRVVGNETVDLPDVQRSVTALRLDATFVVRFKKSSDGQYLPTQTFTQSEWYMPGVGVVRRSSVDPADNGGTTQLDERLVFWDGVTEGMGALPPSKVRAAAGGLALGRPWSAVRVGDRALVGTALRLGAGASFEGGMVLTALNGRGAVVASRSYAALNPGMDPLPLLTLAGGSVGMLTPDTDTGSFPTGDIRLRRFDRDAAPLGNADGMVVLSGVHLGRVAAASDGEKFWLLWVDADTVGQTTRVWLRDFDANGLPVGAAKLLASEPYLGTVISNYGSLTLAAAPGRVLATWADSTYRAQTPQPQMMLALVLGNGSAQVRSMGTLNGFSRSAIQAVVSAERQSLSWAGLAGFDAISNFGDQLRRGVAVADDGSLRRTAAATLDNEVLSTTLGSTSGAMVEGIAFADGASFVSAVTLNAYFMPGVDLSERPLLQINRWVGNDPLAATAPQVTRLRLAGVTMGIGEELGTLRHVVPFDDRLLILGFEDSGLGATVVFRR